MQWNMNHSKAGVERRSGMRLRQGGKEQKNYNQHHRNTKKQAILKKKAGHQKNP